MTKRAVKIPEFRARPGSQLNDRDAQVVGERLYVLFGGRMDRVLASPQRIVEDASSRRSPLHAYFEWNDSKAAEAHRLSQARQLAQAVVEVTITRNESAETTRTESIYFGSLQAPVEKAVSVKREDLVTSVAIRAATELKNWLTRYRMYAGSAKFHHAVAEVEAAYRELIK